MNQASDRALVEEPGAYARPAEPMDTGQIDPALLQRLQHRGWIVRADQADAPHGGSPDGGAQGTVHDGAAGLSHTGAAVREYDIIDQEIAEQHQGGCHL